MIREHFQFRETIATILADREEEISAAKDGMMSARQEIERHIVSDPFFATSFDAYDVPPAGIAVNRMAKAASEAGVGPMAAVAGTIAWAGVEAMAAEGAVFGVVDNGGDIALISDREVRIGIHAGAAPLSNRLAFVVPPQDVVLGICTSSATVGHSISLGAADSVTVFSRDVSCADAWATSICNRINPESSCQVFEGVGGTCICGVLAIAGREVWRWGRMPPLVAAAVDERLITAGRPV